MRVDIHCHILDGIDDGPKTIKEAVELSIKLRKNGIREVIATPHFIADSDFMPTTECIKKKISKLSKELKRQNVDLQIYPGMEVFASDDTIEKLDEGKIFTLNNSKYILLEFPFANVPRYMSDLLFTIQLKGYRPIIAHPERYSALYRKSGIINDAVEKGALLQINSGSLMGLYGSGPYKEALRLLKNGMVHLIATDAHGGKRTIPSIDEVKKALSGICGNKNTNRILHTNPMSVLKDLEVESMASTDKSYFMMGVLKKLGLNM
ncbi:MAG: phosphoesterase [Clostridium sp.]|nr:phosphoesterase [Clostridium sp.]